MLVFCGLVKDFSSQGLGHELHIGKVPGIIVGIFVAVGVMEVLHELRRSIADGQGHRLVAGVLDLGQGAFYGHVGGIALGGGGQVDRGFGQGDPALGHANLGHHLKAGVGQQQGVGIGQTHVFRGTQAQAAGNEEGILTSVNHPGQVIDGRVGIGPADALDKGRNDIVVHLAILVIDGHVFLDGGRYRLVINDDGLLAGLGVNHQLQHIEELAGVTAAVTHQSLAFPHFHGLVLEENILVEGTVQKDLQILFLQGFEYKDLAAGQQGSNDLKRGVLGGCTHQHDGAVFNGSQKGVLLGFVETVDFVYEQDGSPFLAEQAAGLGLVKDLAHILYPRRNGTEGVEIAVQGFGNDMGQGGLTHSGRTPENEGTQVPAFYHFPQDAAFSNQMTLAHILVQRPGSHPLGERRQHHG